MGPELTPEEEKKLAKMVDLQIDDFIEEKHIREVPKITEGNDVGPD